MSVFVNQFGLPQQGKRIKLREHKSNRQTQRTPRTRLDESASQPSGSPHTCPAIYLDVQNAWFLGALGVLAVNNGFDAFALHFTPYRLPQVSEFV